MSNILSPFLFIAIYQIRGKPADELYSCKMLSPALTQTGLPLIENSDEFPELQNCRQ